MERRQRPSASRIEAERHEQQPRSVFVRRQIVRREADKLLDEHDHTDNENIKRELGRAICDAMTAVPLEEERRTMPTDRRNDEEIIPSLGIPLIVA